MYKWIIFFTVICYWNGVGGWAVLEKGVDLFKHNFPKINGKKKKNLIKLIEKTLLHFSSSCIQTSLKFIQIPWSCNQNLKARIKVWISKQFLELIFCRGKIRIAIVILHHITKIFIAMLLQYYIIFTSNRHISVKHLLQVSCMYQSVIDPRFCWLLDILGSWYVQ